MFALQENRKRHREKKGSKRIFLCYDEKNRRTFYGEEEDGMARHILVAFLSDVKVDGTSEGLRRSFYPGLGETVTTNESAVRYLLGKESVGHIDRLFLLASQRVMQEPVQAKNMAKVPDGAGGERYPTSLEIFEQRLEETAGISKEAADVYPFDEQQAALGVVEMATDVARRIQCYAARQGEEQVVLHADMTGGFRTANMVLLSLIRLLQYTGITIGSILYSVYDGKKHEGHVEEVDDIYQMLNLISGAEEFVRFGSVQAIRAYFAGRPQSKELAELLDAMDFFASEIKLCHRQSFMAAIEELHRALDQFQRQQAKWQDRSLGETVQPERVNDKLMLQLEPHLKKDYQELFLAERNPLYAVRWCCRHDDLQQAVTLFTEILPEYLLGEGGCLKLSPSLRASVEALQEERKEDYGVYSFASFFLNHYFPKTREEWETKSDKKINRNKLAGWLQQFIEENRLLRRIRAGQMTPEEAAQQILAWFDAQVGDQVSLSLKAPEKLPADLWAMSQQGKEKDQENLKSFRARVTEEKVCRYIPCCS